MIEEVSEDLYRIELFLPKNYPPSVNIYVVRDGEKSLIIDAGLQVDECLEAMRTALKKLDVRIENADLFLTHCHGDHIGFVTTMMESGSTVYMNRLEAEHIRRIESGELASEFRTIYEMGGFLEGNIEEILSHLIRNDVKLENTIPFQYIGYGYRFKTGKYEFTCMETPGHSKGHMCLYEPYKRLLLSGDHLLEDSGPVIPGRFDNDNPLKEYLSSLHSMNDLDIELVLPGHGRPFKDSKQRIIDTIEHHYRENLNILSILEGGAKTAYEISLEIIGMRSKGSIKRLSVLQVFVLVMGTLGRLRYLEDERKIKKSVRDNVALFSLSQE